MKLFTTLASTFLLASAISSASAESQSCANCVRLDNDHMTPRILRPATPAPSQFKQDPASGNIYRSSKPIQVPAPSAGVQKITPPAPSVQKSTTTAPSVPKSTTAGAAQPKQKNATTGSAPTLNK